MRVTRLTSRLIVLGTCSVLAAAAVTRPVDSQAEAAIHALVKNINLAWNSDAQKGVKIMREVISDKAYTIVAPGPEDASVATIMDKEAMCDLVAQTLQNGPTGHTHKIHRLVTVGSMAYEIGADPKAPTETWLNVFAKEDRGWRLVFSTPAQSFQEASRQLAAIKRDAP